MAVPGAVVSRLTAMLNRIGCGDIVAFSGGVANNLGMVTMLQDKLGVKVVVPPAPDITGALGAALLAAPSL